MLRLSYGFQEDLKFVFPDISFSKDNLHDVNLNIKNFCIFKLNEFQSSHSFLELISFMKDNFSFDSDLNILEIKQHFFSLFKNELLLSINPVFIKYKKPISIFDVHRFSALQFVYDFHTFFQNSSIDELSSSQQELLLRKHRIIDYIVKQFNLNTFFSKFNEQSLVLNKIALRNLSISFTPSFYLLEHNVSSFNDLLLSTDLINLFISSFSIDFLQSYFIRTQDLLLEQNNKDVFFLSDSRFPNSSVSLFTTSIYFHTDLFFENLSRQFLVFKKSDSFKSLRKNLYKTSYIRYGKEETLFLEIF